MKFEILKYWDPQTTWTSISLSCFSSTKTYNTGKRSIIRKSSHVAMLLTFLAFAYSMRFIQSSESPPWNHPSNLEESQQQLHNEIMNPFLAYHVRDHLGSPKANVMASAISETETTMDGYHLSTVYSGLKCQGSVELISVTPLDYCYNVTTKTYSLLKSYKNSFVSTTSNMTTTFYKDDKCVEYLTSFVAYVGGKCANGQRTSNTYSSTNSLPVLPAEPYFRIA